MWCFFFYALRSCVPPATAGPTLNAFSWDIKPSFPSLPFNRVELSETITEPSLSWGRKSKGCKRGRKVWLGAGREVQKSVNAKAWAAWLGAIIHDRDGGSTKSDARMDCVIRAPSSAFRYPSRSFPMKSLGSQTEKGTDSRAINRAFKLRGGRPERSTKEAWACTQQTCVCVLHVCKKYHRFCSVQYLSPSCRSPLLTIQRARHDARKNGCVMVGDAAPYWS